MKILIYGAGVLGSVYGGYLHSSGEDVTFLARGKRYRDLMSHALVLHNAASNDWSYFHVATIERLDMNEAFDYILVFVRGQQVAEVLSSLANYPHPATILVMSASVNGYQQWSELVGPDRLLVGFAGVGGRLEGHVVHFRIASPALQRTLVGEIDGSKSFRVRQLVAIFKRAGFPAAVSPDILAWQQCHLALVCPLAQALYIAGTGEALSKDPALLRLCLSAIREGVQALRSLRVHISPFELRFLEWAPESLLIKNLQRFTASEAFRDLVEAHAWAAPEEMRLLSGEFRQLASRSPASTPAMDTLRQAADLVIDHRGSETSVGPLVA
jgi:2-dehydropantoate 2-reductase